jgi:hypothetical protein
MSSTAFWGGGGEPCGALRQLCHTRAIHRKRSCTAVPATQEAVAWGGHGFWLDEALLGQVFVHMFSSLVITPNRKCWTCCFLTPGCQPERAGSEERQKEGGRPCTPSSHWPPCAGWASQFFLRGRDSEEYPPTDACVILLCKLRRWVRPPCAKSGQALGVQTQRRHHVLAVEL